MPGANPNRTRRDDIKAIRTKRVYELLPHQYWCETKNAFEIHQLIDNQDKMITRIPRRSVLVIIKK